MISKYQLLAQVARNDERIVTVGAFDGVHLGHIALVQRMLALRSDDSVLTAITFEPHPRDVLSNSIVPKLTTLDQRVTELRRAGVDEVIVIPFDRETASLTAEAFLSDILLERIGIKSIVVGHDHRFGRNGEGDAALLRRRGSESSSGFDVYTVPAVIVDGVVASSSNVRSMLQDDGNVAGAATLLGRRYQRAGVVVRGDGRGRTIGFPTANMASSGETIVPRMGVYAVLTSGSGLEKAPSVMNIGIRPTFGGTIVTEEVHVLDWEGDLYDDELTVEFVDRVRPEKKFDSIEALVNQLEQDVNHCRQRLSSVS